MRILQISSAVNFGGGEKHLADLSKGLMQRGHDVFVAVRPSTDWLDKFAFLPDDNFLELPLRNALDVFSAGRLAKFIRKNKIEIVHTHLARDYPVASLATRISPQAKLVLTRHVLFPIKFFQKFVLTNTAKIIAVSSAVETALQKTFPPEKIVSIPNGIEIEKWSRADHKNLREAFRFEHDILFEAPLIGTIGELKFLKGYEDFILAAQIVAEKYPESYFVVVGKDNSFDQSFRRKLKRMVKVFDLERRFLWLDWIENTAEILHALDVFVSASHSESFGLSILEAMASATAVVATETEGAKELIKQNQTGKLVSVSDSVKLAEAISELLNDAPKRKDLGAAAQKSAAERFDLEKMIDETEKLYKSL